MIFSNVFQNSSAKTEPNMCFGCVLAEDFWNILENISVFFPDKNLQLVYPPLWHGPFNENPYAKRCFGGAVEGAL